MTFVSDVSYGNGKIDAENNILKLSATTICHISVYATKEGYENSDEATLDVELHVSKKGDVNADGEITAQDASLILQYVAGKISW